MFYALAANGNRVCAQKGQLAVCPCCRTDVIAKCGEIITHHWAHKSAVECDDWAEAVGPWHWDWQQTVPEDKREVVMGHHRADMIAADGTVVELQHSPISPKVVKERESFYGKMVWIFDGRGKKIDMRPRDPDGVTFRWHGPRSGMVFCKSPILVDLGDGWILNMRQLWPGSNGRGIGYFASEDGVRDWIKEGINPAWH